ncbi:hypothetical protein GVAV_001706 [Gurleya vavrai]
MTKPKFCVLITTIISFVLFTIFLCILIFSSDKSKKNETKTEIEQVQNFENLDFVNIHRKLLNENTLTESDKTKKNEKKTEIEQVRNLNFKNIDFVNIHRKLLNENILTEQNFIIYLIYISFIWEENKEAFLSPQNEPIIRLIQEIFIKSVLDKKIDFNNYQKKIIDAIPNSEGKTYEEILKLIGDKISLCNIKYAEENKNEIPIDLDESYTKIMAKIHDICKKELIYEKYIEYLNKKKFSEISV